MIQAKRLGHVAFETPDLEKAIAYYTEVIGLVLTSRDKNKAFLSTRIGQLAVELGLGTQTQCEKLTFEISPNSEFSDVMRRLADLGLKAERRSDAVPGEGKSVSFTDPKGTTIELFSEWNGLGKRDHGSGVGPTKIGHLAFVVPDPKAIADFYARVLGFRVSDWIEDLFVFLRCNTDHHTVNFIKGDAVTMHHVAFELRDFGHIQNSCELLGSRDIPILWGPLRLGPGHNIAIFHRNQDGQVVELYAELDKMLDEELGYFEPRPWHRDQPQRPKTWTRSQGSIWGVPPAPGFITNFSRPPT
ncbi:MAG: VOC family protein [Xanthobacteraceae bacterium]|nr:VOC family protein [Xanthobacteraceae bacterium]